MVVGSTGEAGEICLTLRGRGLETAKLRLTVVEASGTVVRKPYLEDCTAKVVAFPGRVPVRKLELRAEGGRTLTPDRQELTVDAVLYPANTTDRELVWKAVNASGIDVNFVQIESYRDEQGGEHARFKAVGDGEFYVRCMAKSGDRVVLISHLECRAEGLGYAYLDPYGFISAGLYSDTIGEITSGNEKGIATSRDGVSGVVYSGIDFGEYGSDEITLPVFSFSGEEYPIEIWLGKPGEEGSRLLDRVIYQKPSIWNVYQEETYKLPERIKGIAAISFLMTNKVHLKGFYFKKLEKAYGKLLAGEANAIYGDSFTRDETAVRGIGNNVTIVARYPLKFRSYALFLGIGTTEIKYIANTVKAALAVLGKKGGDEK